MAFAQCVGLLLVWIYENGYAVTFGEAYRTKEQAEWNRAHGSGIANSLHCQRLAIDLNLFLDGDLLVSRDAYEPLGMFWKTLHEDARWGGDFSKPDSDHFSLEWQGVK